MNTVAGRLDGKSILVVEDDPVIIDIVRMPLQHAGATVHAAASLVMARSLLSENSGEPPGVDCIILDAYLDENGLDNGLTLAGEIRARHARLPILLISGEQLSASVGKSIQFLQKPFSFAALLSAVIPMLEERG